MCGGAPSAIGTCAVLFGTVLWCQMVLGSCGLRPLVDWVLPGFDTLACYVCVHPLVCLFGEQGMEWLSICGCSSHLDCMISSTNRHMSF